MSGKVTDGIAALLSNMASHRIGRPVEYDHLFMGNSNNSFSIANPIVAGALNRISQDVDMVTVRVNYRWNWGSPVVANY